VLEERVNHVCPRASLSKHRARLRPDTVESHAGRLGFPGDLDGQRFSPLEEITPANAAQLREICRLQIDGPTTFHAGLVVVDGVIYTNTGLETVAIDAATCALRWRFSYVPDEERASPSNRGLAVLDGRVFRGTRCAQLKRHCRLCPTGESVG
jgi:glucose dehydrogenase